MPKKPASKAKKTTPKQVGGKNEKKASISQIAKVASVNTSAERTPFAITMKRDDAIKLISALAIIIIAIPILDMLLQFALLGRFAAFVGNSQVLRSEYQADLETKYGQEVISNMIVDKLIENEMNAKKITIDEGKINSTIDAIKAQFSNEDEFNSRLKAENLTLDELKHRLRIKTGLDEIVKNDITPVKDEDVKSYFDNNAADAYKDKKFEDVKDSIKQSLEASAISAKGEDWISEKVIAYNKENNLTLAENNKYKLFGSISLLSKFFGKN